MFSKFQKSKISDCSKIFTHGNTIFKPFITRNAVHATELNIQSQRITFQWQRWRDHAERWKTLKSLRLSLDLFAYLRRWSHRMTRRCLPQFINVKKSVKPGAGECRRLSVDETWRDSEQTFAPASGVSCLTLPHHRLYQARSEWAGIARHQQTTRPVDWR